MEPGGSGRVGLIGQRATLAFSRLHSSSALLHQSEGLQLGSGCSPGIHDLQSKPHDLAPEMNQQGYE